MMKKILLLFLTFFTVLSIKAYENDFFKVDIPDNYKQTVNETNMYKWTKDNNYFAVTISDNTKLNYDIINFTDEDLVKQKEYLEKGINEGLKKYNITASVSDIKKVENENKSFLEYNVFYPSKKATGYDTYQKGRMYTTSKYITTVIYNSDSEIKDDNVEFKTIIDSFNILDNNIVIKTITIKDYIILVITIGIIAGIIGAFVSIKKR